ncbi:hypothetical protein V6N11_007484 [Hibiscus sabdariffa]|uniref:Disease resistance R13L4/SHOC-2-like LRR domain-containing protein n=1 Tax=Hibiscus sabdariffa TaxID=183260 RepID=A0ABR2NSA0_9ROSI
MKFVAKSNGTEEVEDSGIHRWSVKAKENEMKAGSKAALSRVRSLFVFAVDETSKTSFNGLPFGFKLMRVLDLEDTPINEIPDELTNLFNLRYLNLTTTQVKELPKDIGKLYNLQFLELERTQIKELLAGIVKLKNLRHLIAYCYNVNPRIVIGNVKETDDKNLCLAISKMVHLEYLVVKSCNEDEKVKMDAIESDPRP